MKEEKKCGGRVYVGDVTVRGWGWGVGVGEYCAQGRVGAGVRVACYSLCLWPSVHATAASWTHAGDNSGIGPNTPPTVHRTPVPFRSPPLDDQRP